MAWAGPIAPPEKKEAIPRIPCDSCNGQRGYSSGGYNEHWNKCKSCGGTGIDIEATLVGLETEIIQLKQELKEAQKKVQSSYESQAETMTIRHGFLVKMIDRLCSEKAILQQRLNSYEN